MASVSATRAARIGRRRLRPDSGAGLTAPAGLSADPALPTGADGLSTGKVVSATGSAAVGTAAPSRACSFASPVRCSLFGGKHVLLSSKESGEPRDLRCFAM